MPINFILLPTGELIAPATAEKNNPRADVISGAPGDDPRAASGTGWRGGRVQVSCAPASLRLLGAT